MPKDYIKYRLTGVIATEPSDASGTGLFDIRKGKWSKEILEKLRIPSSCLPRVLPSGNIAGKVKKQIAGKIGLTGEVSVIGGGADSVAHAVGSGVVRKGVISCTLGTSGVVSAFSEAPARYSFCHVMPGRWLVVQAIHSAGASLKWFRENFAPSESFDVLISKAMKIGPGSEGLIFLPFLLGERIPPGEKGIDGLFYGITLRHTRAHFIRAIMEGICFAFREMVEFLKSQKVEVNEVVVSGGGAKSGEWVQLFSDILSMDVFTLDKEEEAAYGVALLAASQNSSILSSLCEETLQIKEKFSPRSELSKVYRVSYLNYCKLRSALKI